MALVYKTSKSPLAETSTLNARSPNFKRHALVPIFVLKEGLESFVKRTLNALDASRRREAARLIRQYQDLIDKPPE